MNAERKAEFLLSQNKKLNDENKSLKGEIGSIRAENERLRKENENMHERMSMMEKSYDDSYEKLKELIADATMLKEEYYRKIDDAKKLADRFTSASETALKRIRSKVFNK